MLAAFILLLAANLWRTSQPPRPDPRMVSLAVRATVYALPSPTARIIEVTRVVEVTPEPLPTSTPAPTPVPTATVTPTVETTPTPSAESVDPDSQAVLAVQSADAVPEETTQSDAVAQTGEPAEEVLAAAPAAPAESDSSGVCPISSDNSYASIPVEGGGLAHPDSVHADLNLALRSYTPVEVPRELFNKEGPVDSDPPQLAGLFADYRLPGFSQPYRVSDWDWNCGGGGCQGATLEHVEATLITLQTTPNERIGVPHRNAQIYGGDYKAMVLYAEPSRITLGYTREDSVANGYVVHIENICVDPNLLALYQSNNASGRGSLPALREDEWLGTASLGNIRVAVRDRGVFWDPRSRLDWWQGF